MKSFSQYGEDIHLLSILKNAPPALIWDIGAWHAEQLSNSRALIELGWNAVLIEPSPGPLRGLVKAYGKDPKVSVIGAAVSLEQFILRMAITDDAVSTSDEETQRTWSQAGGYFGDLWTHTITLEQLANQFGGADVILIDTEGTSVDLAKRCWALGYSPKVMVVEFDARLPELLAAATQHGYSSYAVTAANAILVRR